MSKFKVGDKVKCIKSDTQYGFKRGEIYTVEAYYNHPNDLSWNIIPYQQPGRDKREGYLINNGGDSNFELVTEESHEELFKKFLEGNEAKNKLVKAGVLEYSSRNGMWFRAGTSPEYRIKPKKEFKSFFVNDSNAPWKVELNGENLQIGCQIFNKLDIKNILDLLLNQGATGVNNTYFAARDGIVYKGNKLKWEDAEKILNALNDYERETK